MGSFQIEKQECKALDGTIILHDIELDIKTGTFALVCGKTGSGKTSLLKMIKKIAGDKAGYVMQDPNSQIVNEKVCDELAFGLTANNIDEKIMSRRIAETASYFGISKWLNRDTATLSGGEKQILNIASAMVKRPEILILDEPVSMLDPVMADKVIDIVKRLNSDYGITVIITEHNPDRLFAMADMVIAIKDKRITYDTKHNMASKMGKDKDLCDLLPAPARIWSTINPVPLSLKDGISLAGMNEKYRTKLNDDETQGDNEVILDVHKLVFSYKKNDRKVLNELTFNVRKGEIYSLLGENGSGKTTTASIIAGILSPYSGYVKIFGKKVRTPGTNCKMLFQDVTCHFVTDDAGPNYNHCHPYDLSGGEKQMLALDILLEKETPLLILDEPAKGLDIDLKCALIKRLKKLAYNKTAILIITHDVEFAADVSDRMALLFDGRVTYEASPKEFCSSNMFYTTCTSKMFENVNKGAYTVRLAKKIVGDN